MFQRRVQKVASLQIACLTVGETIHFQIAAIWKRLTAVVPDFVEVPKQQGGGRTAPSGEQLQVDIDEVAVQETLVKIVGELDVAGGLLPFAASPSFRLVINLRRNTGDEIAAGPLR